jgi:hypothetical protein
MSKPAPVICTANTQIKPRGVKNIDLFMNRFMMFFPSANQIYYHQDSETKAVRPEALQVLLALYRD